MTTISMMLNLYSYCSMVEELHNIIALRFVSYRIGIEDAGFEASMSTSF